MAARTVVVDYLVDVTVGLGAAFALLLLMIIGRAWRRTEPALAPLFSAGDGRGLRIARAVLLALAVAAI